MSEIIEKLVIRLSKYDWFTTLVPGLFLFALLRSVGVRVATESIVEEFGLIFFLGVVSSRVGASCIEQIARWCKLFETYEDYIEWSDAVKDKSDMLVRNSNWFRSLCGMIFVLVGIVMLKSIQLSWLTRKVKVLIAVSLLFVLFVDAYRRQLIYITKRIRRFKQDKAANK